nr:hypothetical protein [uncultured Methanolobus sp.]
MPRAKDGELVALIETGDVTVQVALEMEYRLPLDVRWEKVHKKDPLRKNSNDTYF